MDEKKKRYEGENNQEPRWYGEKDRFSFHNQNLRVPLATKISPSTTQLYESLEDPLDHITTFKTTSILSYIKDEQLPSYLDKAKKIKKWATRFTILNDILQLIAQFDVWRIGWS